MSSDLYGDLRPEADPLPVPKRAMAVGAHPDDIEFGAGGTLAKWAANGCHVTMLIVTDGSKGTWDPDADPAEVAATRRREQQRAAAALGASEIIQLDHVDGELEPTMALREELCRQIRLARPDVLVTHDPWQRYQLHPDHRATGTATLDAVIAARDPLFFPNLGLDAHRPAAVLLWSADAPDHVEPIGETITAKIAALLCHSSQGTTTMGGADQSADKAAEFGERVRTWASEAGAGTEHELAERFKRVTP